MLPYSCSRLIKRIKFSLFMYLRSMTRRDLFLRMKLARLYFSKIQYADPLTYLQSCAYWFGLDEVFYKILKKPSIAQMIPRMKAKLIIIGKKNLKNQIGKNQKMSFSSSANSQYFFTKISGMCSWLRRTY